MNTIHQSCGDTEPHSHPYAADSHTPHHTLTKLCMRLTEAECGALIGDLLQRHPNLQKTVAALCKGGQSQ